MSKRIDAIAMQSATLTQRRLRIHQRKLALHDDAMAMCKQPSTLACAAFAGFVLARIIPMAGAVGLRPSPDGTGTSGMSSIANTIRVVLIGVAPTLVRQAIAAGLASLNNPPEQQR
jgi:hypothetical protein